MTQSMPASKLMIKTEGALPETSKLKEIVRALSRSRAGAVVLLDASGEISGIISNRDVVTHLGHGGSLSTKACEIMTKSPVCAQTTTTIRECARMMQERKCRQLPVVEHGRLVGLLTISELQKVLISDLEAGMEGLKDAQRKLVLRDEYLGIVAHDVRSPLGVIASCCSYLEEAARAGAPPSSDELLSLVASIKQSAQSGVELVEELLDIGRLNSGSKLTREEVDLGHLVEDVLQQLKPLAVQQGVHFVFAPGPATTAMVDKNRIGRALDNIINNAIKFSPAGGAIHVSTRFLPDASGKASAALIVRDEGPGIPEEKLSRLFKRFDQLDSPLANLGFGLGLSIAHQFVALHKGQIQVENHPQGGAQFTIVLPGARLVAGAKSADETQAHVLLVDDDPDTLEVLEEVFRGAGYEVSTAIDGNAGLAEARRLVPDLVVSDIRMPVMDGLMFLNQLKRALPDTPVILVSGHYPTMNDARATTIFRADRFFEKPVREGELLEAAADLLGRRAKGLLKTS